MLKNRRTRTELEISIYKRYEDTSLLIFGDFQRRQRNGQATNRLPPSPSWVNNLYGPENNKAGSSGLNVEKYFKEHDPNGEGLNSSEHIYLEDVKSTDMNVSVNYTKSSICLIL